MAASVIPGFDPDKAQPFLHTALPNSLKGLRHRQAIHGFVRLRLMRCLDKASIAEPDLPDYQKALWPHLAPMRKPSPWLSLCALEKTRVFEQETT
jgi:hypothetical protein